MVASRLAVQQPVQVDVPYREQGVLDPSQAHAAGYRFAVSRGQRIEVELELASEPPGRVFLDLYRLADEVEPLQVASAEQTSRRLAFEPRRVPAFVASASSVSVAT